ncbi:MAG: PEP-CTERM sorting domain-containing protein, partial [Stellaceae bacterium]
PYTASFQLTDLMGNPVSLSIDPFLFSFTSVPVPEPGTLALLGAWLLGAWLLGMAALRRRRS